MARTFLIATVFALGVSAAESALTLEDVIARVKTDAAARAGSSDEIRVVSAAPAVWRDTSMGCGKPTESYAQIDVQGFHIVLERGAKRFDYRARADGFFILCEPALAADRKRK